MRLLVSLVCLLLSSSLSAQSAPVDPDFGTDGRVTFVDFSPLALAVQPSGHVLAVGLGTESAALRRFHPDGRPDLSPGTTPEAFWTTRSAPAACTSSASRANRSAAQQP